MKFAAVLVVCFAVAAIAFNFESKKLPGQLTDDAIIAAGVAEDDDTYGLTDRMERRGGKGKGEEAPPPPPPHGWGWGGGPGWGHQPQPMIIPIPLIFGRGWGGYGSMGGYGGGGGSYGGGGGGYGGGGYGAGGY